MKIEISIPDEIITELRRANDPECEIWKDDSELSEGDIENMVVSVLRKVLI